MTDNTSRLPLRDGLSWWSLAGLVLGLGFFVLSALSAYSNVQNIRASETRIRNTHEVLTTLDDLMIQVLDAETGKRGYHLTGDEQFLRPYEDGSAAARRSLAKLENHTRNDPAQHEKYIELRTAIQRKLDQLSVGVAALRAGDMQEADRLVDAQTSLETMAQVRSRIEEMTETELGIRANRVAEHAAASRATVTGAVGASVIGAVLAIAIFLLLLRTARSQHRRRWLETAQVDLAHAMIGDQSLQQLSATILQFFADRTGCSAGAIFKGEGGVFKRTATLGVPADAPVPTSFAVGEGLLGKAAADGQAIVLNDVPEGYLTIGSALGRDSPRHLVIMPAETEETVNAVIELGFFEPVQPRVLDLLEQTRSAIGVSLRSARFRARLQDALEETQRQAGELQAQSEELRVSNEELEEQGAALKESQARLELQQVELEQTNSQLEEQAQTLENQRDELGRAAANLTLKARELEQASQYKSDFLANMSHELRTPLNSLLILSKLLGDNPDGNLSDEQVRFAQTIESSGNDLLTLINDILDLSKIEAGHVEIVPAPVSTERVASDMRKLFEPVARERGLAFEVTLAPGLEPTIETDRVRLEQILKNLLSNALKFTEQGSVQLELAPAPDDSIAIAVRDTGIGISDEQRDLIFEAFRQADGTISRRFGGTGLGLSITRELVRLLGGTIRLESELGSGSSFIVTLPVVYDPARVGERETAPAGTDDNADLPARAAHGEGRSAGTARPRVPGELHAIADDRDALNEGKRLLLVIEDDPTFARILCELSRELGFQCIIAGTAQEAIELATSYRPHAIVLDIGLPDHSGLTVLDQLKQQHETRHIPIHVVSGEEKSQTALELGAVGFLEKPAKREELASVLAKLQAKFTSRMRRVLVVEDDAVQREAVCSLLRSRDVETVGVGTAADCLEELGTGEYDCMVLDLSLPDASGFTLLETLSQKGEGSFPPVIVYTGRDLSADEEQRLQRYSSSIIIKGAKSPERLLDEVSLFLHQVVADLPAEQRRMIEKARHRDAAIEGKRILIVEDDVRNVYSLTSVLEPRGALTQIARNGQEALDALEAAESDPDKRIDLVLMDVMMPVMDGLAAARKIRANEAWSKLPILMLTAKAMPDDQRKCLEAGANDYMAKPIDVDKLLSLVRVWMPR